MKFVRQAVLAIAATTVCAGAAPALLQDEPKRTAAGHKTAGSLIDINSATAAELKTLPGIGDAWAATIIKHRPYQNKTQLRTRGVLSPAAYKRIRDQIIAKQ